MEPVADACCSVLLVLDAAGLLRHHLPGKDVRHPLPPGALLPLPAAADGGVVFQAGASIRLCWRVETASSGMEHAALLRSVRLVRSADGRRLLSHPVWHRWDRAQPDAGHPLSVIMVPSSALLQEHAAVDPGLWRAKIDLDVLERGGSILGRFWYKMPLLIR